MLARAVAMDPRALRARRVALTLLYEGGASHLGTSMSLIDLLTAVYAFVDVHKIVARSDDRSRVIVSKGHGAAGTYAVMAQFGLIGEAELATYHSNDSFLSGHVSHAVSCVEHSTGALGHGLPVAVGVAAGLRAKGYDAARVFVVLGDGELQEGSNWEAIMLAYHLKLSNLVILLDNNGISSITKTSNIIDMQPYGNRFAGFGLNVYDVDGHDKDALRAALEATATATVPSAIICNTVKGYGVPFAENEPIWHYRTLTKELYTQALSGLGDR